MNCKNNGKTVDLFLTIGELIDIMINSESIWEGNGGYYVGVNSKDAKDRMLVSYHDFIKRLNKPLDDYDASDVITITASCGLAYDIEKAWRDFIGDQNFVEMIINMSISAQECLSLYISICEHGINIILANGDLNAPHYDGHELILKVPRLSTDDMANEYNVDYSNAIAGLIAQYERVVK